MWYVRLHFLPGSMLYTRFYSFCLRFWIKSYISFNAEKDSSWTCHFTTTRLWQTNSNTLQLNYNCYINCYTIKLHQYNCLVSYFRLVGSDLQVFSQEVVWKLIRYPAVTNNKSEFLFLSLESLLLSGCFCGVWL